MCNTRSILAGMTATDAATHAATTAPAPTMLPAPSLLPDVLPTERLTASGKPVPEIRTELLSALPRS